MLLDDQVQHEPSSPSDCPNRPCQGISSCSQQGSMRKALSLVPPFYSWQRPLSTSFGSQGVGYVLRPWVGATPTVADAPTRTATCTSWPTSKRMALAPKPFQAADTMAYSPASADERATLLCVPEYDRRKWPHAADKRQSRCVVSWDTRANSNLRMRQCNLDSPVVQTDVQLVACPNGTDRSSSGATNLHFKGLPPCATFRLPKTANRHDRRLRSSALQQGP